MEEEWTQEVKEQKTGIERSEPVGRAKKKTPESSDRQEATGEASRPATFLEDRGLCVYATVSWAGGSGDGTSWGPLETGYCTA
ncbi:hypothetical protein NDU88_001975 [Pleurodeles waltl]|uniref:Uncharacterized protein n=1 Tax=Pleurodeles waltl TaxID=8319 RepID=A0AAV7Q7I1_PLEWA|nr:hypothetical protein NDU88_001975 [Pleurodeles waltl]